jgi:hypothetical protein
MAIRITFNSVNIDLKVGQRGLEPTLRQFKRSDRSSTGKTQTINSYGIQEVEFQAIFSESVYYSLWAWWSWVRQGKGWAFTFDSDKIGNTTLDDAAPSGQKVIPLTATGAFSIDDICLSKAVDADDEFELVKIASIVSGVSITAVSNLVYSYNSGDVFRHKDYWPNVIYDGNAFNPIRDGEDYHWTFKFFESL